MQLQARFGHGDSDRPDEHNGDDHTADDYSRPREERGVFGVWAPGEGVAKLAYFSLYAS
jgi:amidophosphoribosyltransferase